MTCEGEGNILSDIKSVCSVGNDADLVKDVVALNEDNAKTQSPPSESGTCETECSSMLNANSTMGGFVTKSGHRSSLSSTSSDSGDVSNNNRHQCEVEGLVVEPEFNTPIIGYEVMEERARFTVFKIRVEHADTGQSWYVFRRYTDFTRLNKKLRDLFPGLRLSLPPKRWFGDNFDPLFLEDRLLGLQTFIKNIMCHRDISKSHLIKEFFCLDDPPEPLDTIEESRALCENLEEIVYRLMQQIKEKDAELEMLRAEVALLKTQQSTLVKALKIQNETTVDQVEELSPENSNSQVICEATEKGT